MKEVLDKILKSKSAAVLPHVNEDPDALGSCFAFCEAMKMLGKEAVVYVEEEPQKRFAFLGGDYEVYDPARKYKHDLCVCLDCGDMERLGNRAALFEAAERTVNIDHHFTNTSFAQVNYVEGKASATGEILCMLLPMLTGRINDKIARYLYAAICADTGCFKFSSVCAKTMRLAADLLEYDFDHAEIARALFDSDSLEVVKFKAHLMSNIESYAGGLVKSINLSEDLYEKYNIPPSEVPNVVDIPRRVAGTEVALCFKPKENGIGVNFRSNSYVDVAAIACKFGGGGHERAAGCTVRGGSMEEVKRAVTEECIKAVNNGKN